MKFFILLAVLSVSLVKSAPTRDPDFHEVVNDAVRYMLQVLDISEAEKRELRLRAFEEHPDQSAIVQEVRRKREQNLNVSPDSFAFDALFPGEFNKYFLRKMTRPKNSDILPSTSATKATTPAAKTGATPAAKTGATPAAKATGGKATKSTGTGAAKTGGNNANVNANDKSISGRISAVLDRFRK